MLPFVPSPNLEARSHSIWPNTRRCRNITPSPRFTIHVPTAAIPSLSRHYPLHSVRRNERSARKGETVVFWFVRSHISPIAGPIRCLEYSVGRCRHWSSSVAFKAAKVKIRYALTNDINCSNHTANAGAKYRLLYFFEFNVFFYNSNDTTALSLPNAHITPWHGSIFRLTPTRFRSFPDTPCKSKSILSASRFPHIPNM